MMPKTKKELTNYFEVQQQVTAVSAKPQTIPCENYKHRSFKAGATCLVCNPGYEPVQLSVMCNTPEKREAYEVLQAGQECHAYGCLQRGRHDDTIGYRWCSNHIAAAYWLAEGARQGFPRFEEGAGTTLLAGQESWLKNARACPVDIMRIRSTRYCALESDFFEVLEFAGVSPQEIPENDFWIWYIDASNAYTLYQQYLKEKGGHDGEVEHVEMSAPIVPTIPQDEEEYIDFSL